MVESVNVRMILRLNIILKKSKIIRHHNLENNKIKKLCKASIWLFLILNILCLVPKRKSKFEQSWGLNLF